MTLKTEDGRLVVVSGASRCGKTTQVAKEIKSARRVAAFDPEDQYSQLPGYTKVTTRAELVAALKTKGYVRVAYVFSGNGKEEFEFFCRVVYHVGRYVAPLVVIAEELADVTTSSKAPEQWGILVRRGLKRGITIYAISQRWAEADKTAFGNASEYIIFTSRGGDVQYIANKTGLSVEEVASLKQFEFIRFDPVTKEKQRNKLKF